MVHIDNKALQYCKLQTEIGSELCSYVVEPAYLDLSPRFRISVCIYLDLFYDYPALSIARRLW
jgi:hypothetical protein